MSQPRVAAIERSRNVTLDVLEDYVDAVGGQLEVIVVKGAHKIPLISTRRPKGSRSPAKVTAPAARGRPVKSS